jgi:sec-independent protein translocase protein TatB
MFLFIFESIGTQELVLIGVVALIFLGPRRMPEMARKLGKMMSDFRNTTQEFKSTWEREVNFEDEEKALRTAFTEQPESLPIARENSILTPAEEKVASKPEIREIDASRFDPAAIDPANNESQAARPDYHTESSELEAKQNWL